MNIVILAAGMGKRMRSDLPKVLHRIGGQPMLAHVIAAARALVPAGMTPNIVVVVGHGAPLVREHFPEADLTWVMQEPQRGTGHAVMQAVPHLDDAAPTMILYGDVPLTRPETLRDLLAAGADKALAILTVHLDEPTGYGRIVRNGASIIRIVEQKDANDAERSITEVNTGILVAPTAPLKRWLAALTDDNAQREYYLTDIVGQAVAEGVPVRSASPAAVWETLGVNSKAQLAELERRFQNLCAAELMDAGVTLADPARFDVRGELLCGRDVSIDINCIFEGQVTLGDGVSVGAHCVLRNVSIGAGTRIEPYCHLDGAEVGARGQIGPYARLRPGAQLSDQVHVGNFVEIKNSQIGNNSKANHLSYIGDASIGARVNIGAGTITCNYDGVNKHRTVIEDDVFIGSDTQLVAPVRVGKGATLGAGTTLTRDAPEGQLTVSRAKQTSVRGWTRPLKKLPVQGS